jgi:hypothetical protein
MYIKTYKKYNKMLYLHSVLIKHAEKQKTVNKPILFYMYDRTGRYLYILFTLSIFLN